MSAATYVLVGLGVAAAAVYVTGRVVLRRRLASEAYQRTTVARMDAAAWRRHDNVTYVGAEGYSYAPHSSRHPEGGGSDAPRLGVVKGAVAGGNGGPACKYCGESGGHTGQCPVVSATPKSRGTSA